MLQLWSLSGCTFAPAVAVAATAITTASGAATFESSTAAPGLLLAAPAVPDALTATGTGKRPRAVTRL